MITMCLIGVAVAGSDFAVWLGAGFEAAKAGMAVGPRAMVVASSKAIILLGASDVFSLSNIILLRPGEHGPPPAAREVADCLFPSGAEKYSGRMFQSGCGNVK